MPPGERNIPIMSIEYWQLVRNLQAAGEQTRGAQKDVGRL
jgi:hypothetical protein